MGKKLREAASGLRAFLAESKVKLEALAILSRPLP
jgi:hypothetical protein